MSETITIELADCTNVLLREIAAKECTQRDVAMSYAMAIRSTFPTDWKAVNEAIVKRWPKGLERIKKMAWSGKCFPKEPNHV